MQTSRFHSRSAFTLIELLVVIAIILVLAGLAIGPISQNIVRGQLVDTMNNARNFHRATFQMEMDSLTAGVDQGWPGATGFTDFMTQLRDGGYMDEANIRRALRAPGVVPTATAFPPDRSALMFYQTTSVSQDDSIFISSQNWNAASPAALDPAAMPFGNNGFVIIRKGGDAQQFQAAFATNPDILPQAPTGGGGGGGPVQPAQMAGVPAAGTATP